MDAEATVMEMEFPEAHREPQPSQQEQPATVHQSGVLTEPLQAAVPITDHPQQPQENPREQVLLQPEAAVPRTGRSIQGPAPLHPKAGPPIPVPSVVRHQDHPDLRHTAGQVLQDRLPTAGRVPQDHLPTAGPAPPDPHRIADQAAADHIPVAAGQADRQVLIQVAADRPVVALHRPQAAVPGQADQVAHEDNNHCPG